jgi:hypothetical protein
MRAAFIGIGFDAGRLAAETQIASSVGWEFHFNRQNYEGEWSGIALRSNSPRPERYSLYIDPAEPFRDTEIFQRLPYFRQCIQSLPFDIRAARILRLTPGSMIREHRDLGVSIEDEHARFHIAISSNPETEFAVGGAPIVLPLGECWYVNVDLPHRIENRGTSDRVHLIVDADVTPELRDRVLSATRFY